MTYKERVAQHKRELETKQIELSTRLNELFQHFDYTVAQNTSHLNRLLTTSAYRKRDIDAIDRMLNDNKYLATQFLVVDNNGELMDYNTVAGALDYADKRIAEVQNAYTSRITETDVILQQFEELLSRYERRDITTEELERFADRNKQGNIKSWKLLNITVPSNSGKIHNLWSLFNQQVNAVGREEVARRLSSAPMDIIDSLQTVMFYYGDDESTTPYTELCEVIMGGAVDLAMAYEAGDLEYADESW